MAKKESSKKQEKPQTTEVLYVLPEQGVSVMASSVEEAVAKAKEMTKEK